MANFISITKSGLRQKLLAYFFSNPEKKLYLREITVILQVDAGNLSKELARLVNEGIFKVEVRGNQKYFFLNQQYPLYHELAKIIFKTVGIEGGLKKILQEISGIKSAFIYGSFAKNKQNICSDIDLAIIGEIDEDKLLEILEKAQNDFSREINYTLYSLADWQKMKKMTNTFTANILNEPKIILMGNKDEL